MLSLTKYEKYILVFLVFTGLLGMVLLSHKKALNEPALETRDSTVLIERKRPRLPSVININTATENELTTLKGIGPALAKRIIEYRKSHGYFSMKRDLENVRGIGPAKYENIKEVIRVE